MPGQPSFPCTGTLDRMASRLVHPYPTLRFTRDNPFVLSISGSRYSRTQERSICCRLVPYLRTSLSLSLSLSHRLVLCYPVALTVFFYHVFVFSFFFKYYFILVGFMILFGSLSCARPDPFVIHSASSGTPGSHTPAGMFSGQQTHRSPRAHHRLAHTNSFFGL